MNFLSHYYFDKHNTNNYEVLGTVLPDLVKNANKKWNLHPEKHPGLFISNPDLRSILHGWQRHLEIDRLFHNSDFFKTHTKEIRKKCQNILKNSPVRPFFVGHIALELMLDSLLITELGLDAELLYIKLEKAEKNVTDTFLKLSGLKTTGGFFSFYDEFLRVRYLKSYADPSSILYAVNRICMRVWPSALNDTQKVQLTGILTEYHEALKDDFISIFTLINTCLDN